MRQYPETTPRIIVDQDTSPDIVRRIESFDRSIHQDPKAYLEALDTLGDELINPTQSVIEQSSHPRVTNPEITRQIIDYFFERDDRSSSYDPETEQLIQANETHQRLLADSRATNQSPIRAGHYNPEADRARDAVRRFRLRFFIGRVANFQARNQAKPEDREKMLIINS